MRRDWELVRKILTAIGNDGITDTDGLMSSVLADRTMVNYHVALLASPGVQLLAGRFDRPSPGSFGHGGVPKWVDLELTWAGNDFVDAAEDDRTWKKMKKAFINHAPGVLVAMLKTAGNVAVTAGTAAAMGVILADTEDPPAGKAKPGPTARKR